MSYDFLSLKNVDGNVVKSSLQFIKILCDEDANNDNENEQKSPDSEDI